MSFYDYYQKIRTIQINNVNTNNNWELTPIDHVEQGIRQEPGDESEYQFNPERGYVPNKKQLTLPSFTAHPPKNED